MDKKSNATSGFILLGFSDLHYNPYAAFSIVLIIYMLTWMGNTLLLITIYISPQLHTPMYFFLGNLSVVDIFYSTVTVPTLLSSVLHGLTTISYFCCFLQMFFFFFFGFGDIYLLAIMAFDCYLAICNPLRYTSIMDKKIRVTVIVICWLAAFTHGFLYSYTLSQASYCEDRLVRQFYCDVVPFIKLACAGSTLPKLLLYTEGVSDYFYSLPLHTIDLRVHHSSHTKAEKQHWPQQNLLLLLFSSHGDFASSYDRVVSLGYTVLVPMMNSFIYSLRNQENCVVKKTESLPQGPHHGACICFMDAGFAAHCGVSLTIHEILLPMLLVDIL
ncbi:olfactory receptor 4E2-like [Gastrophryne carolinensis]